jgi:hypothetical protein
VVDALRKNGFDAGTNYAPLTDFLPKLLRNQFQPDGEKWGQSVMTLWIDPRYDDERITEGATIIKTIIGAKSTSRPRQPI